MINETSSVVSKLLDDQNTWLAMKILMFGITPAISIFGFAGNILSIIVLVKHGMSKCSNILLVILAFCNIIYLVSFNNVPKIIYEAVWNHEYVGYSKSTCDALFILFTIFILCDYTFGLMGMTLPMLITVERLVVIFFPFKFKQLLTPTRTWLTIVCVCFYWLSIFVYSSFWQVLDYSFDSTRNISLGLFKKSTFYNDNPESVATIQNLMVYTSIIIPPIFTVSGCIVISIHIQMASVKRKKMTSSMRSTNRTTKTLLAVCAVYCVTSAVLSLPLYIPAEYASYALTDEAPSNVGKLFYELANIVGCIQSSSDFIVYIGLNKQFRDTLRQLFAFSFHRLIYGFHRV
ncbi:neuropeptides capa receptor [Biomphalaria pfeifferi]|uniref:Neuropeptides capa receptor n=1 Tax=Biomphalaria pfeifferi TaxID=112525 RepID=A0AAD8BLR9_BIOPF|nr:neuropeptides capa receptor [Biomphalaria pfeifferi]